MEMENVHFIIWFCFAWNINLKKQCFFPQKIALKNRWGLNLSTCVLTGLNWVKVWLYRSSYCLFLWAVSGRGCRSNSSVRGGYSLGEASGRKRQGAQSCWWAICCSPLWWNSEGGGDQTQPQLHPQSASHDRLDVRDQLLLYSWFKFSCCLNDTTNLY